MFQADSPPTLCRRAHPKSIEGSGRQTRLLRLCQSEQPGRAGLLGPQSGYGRMKLRRKKKERGGKRRRKKVWEELSLHRHHQNDSWIKMGSDESHFNVSVGSDGQSHKTVSTNHNLLLFSLWRQRKRSGPPFPSASLADSSLLARERARWWWWCGA